MSKIKTFFIKLYQVKLHIFVFVFSFLFFMIIFFPEDKAINILLSTISKQTGIKIDPEEPSLGFFPSLSIGANSAKINIPQQKDMIQLGETLIEVPLSSLITFSPLVQIKSDSFKGNINARILGIPINPARRLEELYLDIDSSGLDLKTILKDLPIDINALVELLVQGNFNIINPAFSDLDISANLSKIKVEEGLFMGFPVPEISIRSAKIAIALDKGEVIIAMFDFGSPNEDINLSLKGRVSLRANKAYDLNLKLKLAGQLEKQFGQFLTMLPPGSKNSEGFYNIKISGNQRMPMPQISPIQ
jgi:type II secretion system protein N